MKKYLSRMLVPLSAITVAFAVFAGPALLHTVNAAESGCVNCHTNEKMLKSLHSPVKIEISEGVG
jgi:nitrate/TMAO reductase-like tetraheme cytochrome c subunit